MARAALAYTTAKYFLMRPSQRNCLGSGAASIYSAIYLFNVAIAVLSAMRLVRLSLSLTSSGWQLIENQAILLWDEGSLQTYWLDDRRSAPVAGNARGRDLDVAAANKRPAASCSKEILLQYHRPFDIRWSLSVVPRRALHHSTK